MKARSFIPFQVDSVPGKTMIYRYLWEKTPGYITMPWTLIVPDAVGFKLKQKLPFHLEMFFQLVYESKGQIIAFPEP